MTPRKVGELHHNGPDQVQQYLDTALRLTAECDLGDVSPDVFFAEALRLVASKQVFVEQLAHGGGLVLNGPR